MSNEFYNHTTYPATSATGSSASARAEFDAITTGFGLLPTMAANGNSIVVVNAGATALTVVATVPVAQGGTAIASYTAGDIIYASGATTFTKLAKGTAYQALLMNSGATAPSWGASLQSLLTTTGDIVYASSANTPARLALGTTLQVLRTNAGVTAPEWYTPATVFGSVAWSIITADPANAVVGTRYACNTTSAAFTVTLPASASAGDKIGFRDYAGTWALNNLTIARNGLKVEGATTNLVCDVNNAAFTLEYIDVTRGWELV